MPPMVNSTSGSPLAREIAILEETAPARDVGRNTGMPRAAAVMGVGVDDVIHLLLTARNGTRLGLGKTDAFSMAIASAGTSIVQTTVIIMLGLLILLFSAFVSAAWTGLLSILSLGAATAVTLVVVPRLPFGLKDGSITGR